MKLKKYSTKRFAGTSDVSIEFTDGLNVVLGNNESGKSTMIEGIFRSLTTSVYLDKRTDKDFVNNFFPTVGGNVIDSKLDFKDGGKEYALFKTWVNGKQGQYVSLEETGGKMMSAKEAEAWLSEILKYGEGIYGNVIFGRQNNEAKILEWLYAFLNNDANDDRDEAKKIISQALSAAGGISIDKLTELLDTEIKNRENNWDFSKNAPYKNKQNGIGTIHKKYNELSEAKKAAEKARNEIEELEKCRKELSENKEKSAELKRERDEYAAKKSEVETRMTRVELAEEQANKYDRCEKALAAWSEAEDKLTSAKPLLEMQQEIKNRERHNELTNIIAEIKELSDVLKADEKELSSLEGISDDYGKAEKLDKDIARNKLTLSAGELTTQVKMVKPHTAEITHAEGSESVSDSAEIRAKGFVSLNIPDVAEIIVAPKNVDVAEIRTKLEADEKALSEILGKYSVGSIGELEELKNKYDDKKHRIEINKSKLENKLNGKELSELEHELSDINISNAIIPEDLERKAGELLNNTGVKPLGDFVKKCELLIESYTEQYSSIENLRAELEKYSGAKEYLEKLNNDDTPNKADFDRRIAELDSKIKSTQDKTEELQRLLGSLESADDIDLSELEEAVSSAEKAFECEKKECIDYKKIRNDLDKLKENSGDDLSGFYDKFNGYLSEISGGRLKFSGESSLQSGTNTISGSELLSEGTKKTVTLAFRLAVLDFFYPNGGGFAVLDDPLIDMDPERREHSAAMLKKFAESNQVIITTCDPAVAELLSANAIQI